MDPATIVQLVDACIGIVKAIAEIGSAARDAYGMPASLRSIFDQLPVLEELLNAARAQGQHEDPTNDKQQSVKPILSSCQQALGEMRDLFEEACPEDESNRTRRVWKGMKFYLGKNSKLRKLLDTVLDNLKLLEMKEVVVIGDKLDELQKLTEGLDPEGGSGKNVHYGSGSNFSHESGGTQNNTVSSGPNARQITTQSYQEGK
jgi:hypothetical protein